MFVLLLAFMLISIFKAYDFAINIEIFDNFFNTFVERNNNNNNEERTIRRKILNWFNENFENITDDNTRFTIEQLISTLVIKLGASVFLGILDFIPGGFVIAGIINSIINSSFINKIGNRAKDFLANKIRNSGRRENLINICKGYKDSISLFGSLRDKNDWTRKIRILNS